ncbi:hypothetical protein D3C78_1339310 [compost metagenome]
MPNVSDCRPISVPALFTKFCVRLRMFPCTAPWLFNVAPAKDRLPSLRTAPSLVSVCACISLLPWLSSDPSFTSSSVTLTARESLPSRLPRFNQLVAVTWVCPP